MPSLRVNWRIFITCRDCKSVYEVEDINSSVGVVGHGNRMLIATVPNQCPDCRNIRLVGVESKKEESNGSD